MNDQEGIELLREAVRWLRFQNMDKAKAAVHDLLDTEQKKAVFEMTDGISSSRTIATKTGLSQPTIVKWWSIWFSAGILVEKNHGYQKLFSLGDLGIEVPTTAEPQINNKTALARKNNK